MLERTLQKFLERVSSRRAHTQAWTVALQCKFKLGTFWSYWSYIFPKTQHDAKKNENCEKRARGREGTPRCRIGCGKRASRCGRETSRSIYAKYDLAFAKNKSNKWCKKGDSVALELDLSVNFMLDARWDHCTNDPVIVSCQHSTELYINCEMLRELCNSAWTCPCEFAGRLCGANAHVSSQSDPICVDLFTIYVFRYPPLQNIGLCARPNERNVHDNLRSVFSSADLGDWNVYVERIASLTNRIVHSNTSKLRYRKYERDSRAIISSRQLSQREIL